MKIAFWVEHFSLRGSEIATFDYAYYNEILLKNQSIIVVPFSYVTKQHYTGYNINDVIVENKFRHHFPVRVFDSYEHLDQILIEEKCDILYNLKDGTKNITFKFSIPYTVHCVFTCNEENKHADKYIAVSNDINHINAPIVPHIVKRLPTVENNLRNELGIPDNAIVFGRHGGIECFDISYVKKVIAHIVQHHENIHFLFMNTNIIFSHERIHYLDANTDVIFKAKFISSCDAMLYARDQGESFGLAIAEFTTLGKPIILPKSSKENFHHINTLKDTAIYFDNFEELYNILVSFDPSKAPKPINYADIYTPHYVMKLFDKYIISNRQNDKYLSLKIFCNWCSTSIIHQNYQKLIHDNKVRFVNENPDYWIVLNKPPNNNSFDPKRTIVMGMEPDTFSSSRWEWYSDKYQYLFFLDENYQNNWEWWLSQTNKELQNIHPQKTKQKTISAIVSSQTVYPAHKLRLLFLKEAEQELNFDIYGYDNNYEFISYRGPLTQSKDDGLLPYKYTFAAENTSRDNYCTEKLIDGILAECLVFYWGCTNLSSFIHPLSYIWLDITNITKSIRTIRQTIENNAWENHIKYIQISKQRILNYNSFIPRVVGLDKVVKLKKKTINLTTRPEKWLEHINKCQEIFLPNVERFEAINGKDYYMTSPYIQNLFQFTQNFVGPNRNTHGIVGCALSHYELWKEIRDINLPMLVMEDDITFQPRFVDKMGNLLNMLDTSDWDIIFIGYHIHEENYEEHQLKHTYLQDNFLPWELVSFEYMIKYGTHSDASGLHGGGTFGYLLSPQGANKLLDTVKKTRFYFPVDYMILECGLHYGLKIQVCSQPLVVSPKFGYTTQESDIQM